MTEPITIILVDDHEVVRKGVRAYLETLPDFKVVGEASSGEEAIALVLEWIPDVVLIDQAGIVRFVSGGVGGAQQLESELAKLP